MAPGREIQEGREWSKCVKGREIRSLYEGKESWKGEKERDGK